MINTLPLISFNDAGDSRPVIKWRILICEVDAHLVIFFHCAAPELDWRSFCGDRPAESIQSAGRKLQGQELITEKAAARDFAKSFFKKRKVAAFSKCAASNDGGESVWDVTGALPLVHFNSEPSEEGQGAQIPASQIFFFLPL